MDISIFSWIFAGIAGFLTLLIWYAGRNDDYWKKRGVPHVPRKNFFARLYEMNKKGMAGLVKDLGLSKLGRVYGTFEGSKPVVIVTDPDLLRDILVKDFHVFPYRRVSNIGDPVADSVVMNLTGDDWKRVRTIITPAFTSKRMRQGATIFKFRRREAIKAPDNMGKEGLQSAFKSLLEENRDITEDETDRFGSIISNGIAPPTQKYKKLSETELLAQCVLFFLVGYETTATVLTFSAYSLAVNPEWQEKLIKEVDEAFEKHSEMSYDSVRDMKILDAVVSETLRMHPPLASTERAAVEDYELGNTGVLVEKGMHVLIPIYGMHYDPEFFEDPEIFKPERFMDFSDPKHPQYAYLPFGMGPRNCLGMRFALLEIKVCLANLLHRYRLKPHSSTKVPLEYKKGLVLLTVTELPLILEKRTDVK
ncbi:Cytochrome P450 3A8 [Araneus ventricosus]|uniref:Cytochrome P450 3A8 n=1 Tax=Araneus ventricosus TaxID=182803 RepID=A0A4Y2G3D2_ARAVE|nr:Cytochrome P450 3A8 [Araneus ventricosus]